MKVFSDIKSWQSHRKTINDSLGYVATMGHLHHGHGSLLTRSVRENQQTVLSIYVNSTQFNNNSDYDNYPRTLSDDLSYAEQMNVDYVLLPSYEAMYPDDYRYQIYENKLSTIMEGEYRPGHFTGVLTVIMKFLMLIRPTKAYFGKKDFQQFQLIKDMVRAFFIDCTIVACETERDEAGLALSSRNSRLNEQQLRKARQFAEILSSKQPIITIIKQLTALNIKVDYIKEYEGRRYGAVFIDEVRLIDNKPIIEEV